MVVAVIKMKYNAVGKSQSGSSRYKNRALIMPITNNNRNDNNVAIGGVAARTTKSNEENRDDKRGLQRGEVKLNETYCDPT